jgi:hypothetical protein
LACERCLRIRFRVEVPVGCHDMLMFPGLKASHSLSIADPQTVDNSQFGVVVHTEL